MTKTAGALRCLLNKADVATAFDTSRPEYCRVLRFYGETQIFFNIVL